jgi:hypothetical protein
MMLNFTREFRGRTLRKRIRPAAGLSETAVNKQLDALVETMSKKSSSNARSMWKEYRYWETHELAEEDRQRGGEKRMRKEIIGTNRCDVAGSVVQRQFVQKRYEQIESKTGTDPQWLWARTSFVGDCHKYTANNVRDKVTLMKEVHKRARPVIQFFKQRNCTIFLSAGSLLAWRRGLREPIEWDDDVDYTVVVTEEWEAMQTALQQELSRLERETGLVCLYFGSNGKQATVKFAARLQADADVTPLALNRSRRYQLEAGEVRKRGEGRSVSSFRVHALQKSAGQRQVNMENLSLQVVDFNCVFAKPMPAGNKITFSERPFPNEFQLPKTVSIQNARYMANVVPMLPTKLVDAWLQTAYGNDWRTPARANKY